MVKSDYKMTISRTTIDKLGIKMYDRPSAVLAELVANAYDADAENVSVSLPMGKGLATEQKGMIVDQGFEIIITDDGIGMEPNVIDAFYLTIGSDRRKDARRGNLSKKKKRNVMGRKGIGKLAPFGICKEVEVRSAGGEKTSKGYKIANFILKYDEINEETEISYVPDKGNEDGQFSETSGTIVTLRKFHKRKTPDPIIFGRQMARRFGLELPDFKVRLIDPYNPTCFHLNPLNIEHDPDVTINLDDKPIILDNGDSLRIKGWIAYAKKPYKNEDVAGVRIYARGKIVSSTRDFGIESGFQGEYSVRSYLVGQIHAEWLDDDEDLIRSDRQDILWDSEFASSFQKWGKERIRELGKLSFKPMREKTWKMFMEKSNMEEDVKEEFEGDELQETAMKLGKTIGQIADRDNLEDNEYVDSLKQLVYTVTPHKMLVDRLQKIHNIENSENPLEFILKIFSDAQIAEVASLGQVALERIRILRELEKLIRTNPTDDELKLQKLLEGSPWLIDPHWTMLTSNRSFSNMRKAFEGWYKNTHNKEISTTSLSKDENKRPDFVLLNTTSKTVEIVEIKVPEHKLEDTEWDRILTYHDRIVEFLSVHEEFKEEFSEIHVTLICDKIKLSSTPKLAYTKFIDDRILTKKNWERILKDSINTHQSFLDRYSKTSS